jgi:[CysO sulfur-carrier protein]-S-L-cysteine hydrolase
MDLLGEDAASFLQLSPQLWGLMVADVSVRAPLEACGLLAGTGNTCLAVYPLTNILHSPTRYQIDPQEQFHTFQLIEENGWDLLAIYHSHPRGPATLSPSDIAEAFYPQAVYLVWYLEEGAWNCRGFRVQRQILEEISILVNSGEKPQDSSS